MEKLKEGDYVCDLNSRLFNELMQISGNIFCSWEVSQMEDETNGFLSKSLCYHKGALIHSEKHRLRNELTKKEFKQRAINTFGNGATYRHLV